MELYHNHPIVRSVVENMLLDNLYRMRDRGAELNEITDKGQYSFSHTHNPQNLPQQSVSSLVFAHKWTTNEGGRYIYRADSRSVPSQ